MPLNRKILLVFLAVIACGSSFGQQSPFNPVSYRIYTPFVLNPAAAGSKDYLSVDMNAGFRGQSASQILSGNTRLTKKVLGYLPSGRTYSYSNVGVGLYGYNEYESADSTHNAGVSASGAYHIPLSRRGLSFVSIGAAVKGMYHFKEGKARTRKSLTRNSLIPISTLVYIFTIQWLMPGFLRPICLSRRRHGNAS